MLNAIRVVAAFGLGVLFVWSLRKHEEEKDARKWEAELRDYKERTGRTSWSIEDMFADARLRREGRKAQFEKRVGRLSNMEKTS